MVARDNASSVQGQVIRITPLNTDGSIDTSKPVFTTKGFISASFSPEFSDGDEIEQKRADGGICISWKAPDTLKRLNFSLSLCTPDPEAAGLLAGGKVICGPYTGTNPALAGTSEIVGYSSPVVGAIAGNPVAVEIWSIANIGGKPAAGAAYYHWVFPFVLVRFDGDREFSNTALSNEFSGQALGNGALVPAGLLEPGDDFVTYKEALANPFSYVRANDLPKTGWSGGPSGDGSFAFTKDNSLGCVVSAVPPGTPLPTGLASDPTHDGQGEIQFSPDDSAATSLADLVGVATHLVKFGAGNYVTLYPVDGTITVAHYDGTAWVLGVSTGDTDVDAVKPLDVFVSGGNDAIVTNEPSDPDYSAAQTEMNSRYTPANTAAWATGEYIVVDEFTWYWDGTQWVGDVAP